MMTLDEIKFLKNKPLQFFDILSNRIQLLNPMFFSKEFIFKLFQELDSIVWFDVTGYVLNHENLRTKLEPEEYFLRNLPEKFEYILKVKTLGRWKEFQELADIVLDDMLEDLDKDLERKLTMAESLNFSIAREHFHCYRDLISKISETTK